MCPETRRDGITLHMNGEGWASKGSEKQSSRSCPPADGHPGTLKMMSSLPTPGSADPRLWGPRFFRGTIDKPRTPTTGVRATQPADFQGGV